MVDSRLVYVCIGAVIGLAVDAIVHHIGIAVSCYENWQSLRDKKRHLSRIMLHLEESQWELNNEYGTSTLAVKNWVEKMLTLNEEACERVKCYSAPSWLNVIARYRMSKQIAKTLSDIDKQLKSCVPLIQLDLQVWQVTQIHTHSQLIGSHLMQESIAGQLEGFSQSAATGRVLKTAMATGFVLNTVMDKVIDMATYKILHHINIMFQFKTELASLTELLESIRPIFTEIKQIRPIFTEIKQFMPKTDALDFWLKDMSKLINQAVETARVVVPWWNIIRRYKESKQITSLISKIDENVKLAPLINLEPLSHGIHLIECLRQDLCDLPRAPHPGPSNLPRGICKEQPGPSKQNPNQKEWKPRATEETYMRHSLVGRDYAL